MKLIKIDMRGVDKGLYGWNGVRFAVCHAPEDRLVKRLITFQGCREEVIKLLRKAVTAKRNRPDERKTRLLVYCRARIQNPALKPEQQERHCKPQVALIRKQLALGHKLVNHWEKKHGWPLTKLYMVDSEGDPQMVMNMMVGSNKWQKTPHYMSLYMLILRLGRSGFTTNSWSHDQIKRRLNAFARSSNMDATHVSYTANKWDVLLANHKTIVGRHTMEELYSRKRLANSNTGYSEGISAFCNGNSYDLLLSYKFQDVCRKVGIYQRVNRKPDVRITGG